MGVTYPGDKCICFYEYAAFYVKVKPENPSQNNNELKWKCPECKNTWEWKDDKWERIKIRL